MKFKFGLPYKILESGSEIIMGYHSFCQNLTQVLSSLPAVIHQAHFPAVVLCP
jgi:hypothetical protein